MSDLPKPQPTLQGWPRRSAQAAASNPAASESPLKLPDRAASPDDEVIEPPRPPSPSIKLPGKPANPAAPSAAAGRRAEIVGKSQEFIGEAPVVELAADGSRELRSFQLQYQGSRRRLRRGPLLWVQAATALTALLVGYGLGGRRAGPSAGPARGVEVSALGPPTAEEQRELDAAFTALRSPRHAEAQRMFTALAQKRPDWGELRAQIALAALYGNDVATFEKLINQGENTGAIAPADGQLLLGQQFMDAKEFEDANRCLGQAVGADPSRADTYYSWGDCLVRSGRPNEAVEKFRAARLRNFDPMLDHVYLSRLWIAEVASGLEHTDGAAAQIDQALAAERPMSPALFARAARAVTTGRFAEAAEALTQVQVITQPVTFHLMLQDPLFYEEHWRPELAGFYAGGTHGRPPASPAPAPGVPPR